MRKIIGLLMGLMMLVPLAFSQEKDYYELSYARLNHVQGDVFVQRTEGLGQEAGVALVATPFSPNTAVSRSTLVITQIWMKSQAAATSAADPAGRTPWAWAASVFWRVRSKPTTVWPFEQSRLVKP